MIGSDQVQEPYRHLQQALLGDERLLFSNALQRQSLDPRLVLRILTTLRRMQRLPSDQ
jgi:hypothetical protein